MAVLKVANIQELDCLSTVLLNKLSVQLPRNLVFETLLSSLGASDLCEQAIEACLDEHSPARTDQRPHMLHIPETPRPKLRVKLCIHKMMIK